MELPPDVLTTLEKIASDREAMEDLRRRIIKWAAELEERLGQEKTDAQG